MAERQWFKNQVLKDRPRGSLILSVFSSLLYIQTIYTEYTLFQSSELRTIEFLRTSKIQEHKLDFPARYETLYSRVCVCVCVTLCAETHDGLSLSLFLYFRCFMQQGRQPSGQRCGYMNSTLFSIYALGNLPFSLYLFFNFFFLFCFYSFFTRPRIYMQEEQRRLSCLFFQHFFFSSSLFFLFSLQFFQLTKRRGLSTI